MKVDYPYRLLLDYHFVAEVAKGKVFNSRQKFDILTWLMHIKATSKVHKRDHNLILEEQFNRLIADNVMTGDEIRKIAKPTSLPGTFSTLNGKYIVPNIIEAIILTNDSPWACTILTSEEKQGAYFSSRHIKGLKDIQTVSGKEAYTLVNSLMRTYELNKDQR